MPKWTLIILSFFLYTCAEPTYETVDGILQVPENRENPNSRTLDLVYKVLKAKKADSLKAPIVILSGGPGAPTLFLEESWKNHPLRNDRDIVLMDQRGTGASEANCTEFGEAMFAIMRKDLDQEGEINALDSLMLECKKTMKQNGVDLAGYSSRENAADFEDLRKALEYDKWNLMGYSYGSRLGLTIMRDFPNSVRSSVFVGVSSPESRLFEEVIGNFENSLFEVLLRCEQSQECNTQYPNLKERLLRSLKKLQSTPLQFDYNSKSFILNRRDALLLLHQSLYSRYSIEYLPNLIVALDNSKPEPIINALDRVEFIYDLVNWPMNNSVTAFEVLPFIDSLEINKEFEKSVLGFDITTFEGFSSLSDFHPYRAPILENRPVISEIPTLMVSGILDPVTPPNIAQKALKHLKNGYGIVFPDESHDLYNPCFSQIVEDFLIDPSKKPLIDCSTKSNPIEWKLN